MLARPINSISRIISESSNSLSRDRDVPLAKIFALDISFTSLFNFFISYIYICFFYIYIQQVWPARPLHLLISDGFMHGARADCKLPSFASSIILDPRVVKRSRLFQLMHRPRYFIHFVHFVSRPVIYKCNITIFLSNGL